MSRRGVSSPARTATEPDTSRILSATTPSNVRLVGVSIVHRAIACSLHMAARSSGRAHPRYDISRLPKVKMYRDHGTARPGLRHPAQRLWLYCPGANPPEPPLPRPAPSCSAPLYSNHHTLPLLLSV